MLYRGVLATDLSGTLNGMVAARNRGGAYLREHVIPVDPETTRQVNCRDAFADLWGFWSATFDQADRDLWETYARSHLRTGRIGHRRELVGWTAFCRQNYHIAQYYQQFGGVLSLGTSPPTQAASFNILPYLTYSLESTYNVNFSDADTWRTDATNALLVYLSAPQPATRNFYKGPYQLAGAVFGDEFAPPSTPEPITHGVQPDPGQRVWYRIFAVSQDRERAGPFEGRIDIT